MIIPLSLSLSLSLSPPALPISLSLPPSLPPPSSPPPSLSLSRNEFLHGDKSLPIYDRLHSNYSYGEAISILLKPVNSRCCSKQPVYIEESCTFVVNLNSLEHPEDIKSDDCGHWIHKGRKSTKAVVWLHNSKVIRVESTTNTTPPDENSKVFTLVRTYYSHDPHTDFKRTFYHLFGKLMSVIVYVACYNNTKQV